MIFKSSKKHKKSRFYALTLCVLAGLTMTGCASRENTRSDYAALDPFEGANRAVLQFNEGVDKAVLEPVARGYRAATTKGMRKGVSNVLTNLRSPVDLGNQLLQGDMEGAGNQTFRTVVNTMAGFGGIVDVAAMEGYPYEREDFGQTLAVWGVGHGAYLMVPIFGPSSLRDGAGKIADGFADPLRIYLFNVDKEYWQYIRSGTEAVSEREKLLEVIDDLRRNSFDYYAAVRSTYLQNRAAMVKDQDANNAGPEIPDYDDE